MVLLIFGIVKFQLFLYVVLLQNILYEGLFVVGISDINKYFYKIYQMLEFMKKNLFQRMELLIIDSSYYLYKENFEDSVLLSEDLKDRRRKKLQGLIVENRTSRGSKASRPPRNAGVAGVRVKSPDTTYGWIPVGIIPRMWKHKIDELRLIIISLFSLLFFIATFSSPFKKSGRRYWKGAKRLLFIKWYWVRRRTRKVEKGIAAFYTIKSFYYNQKSNNINFRNSRIDPGYKLFITLLISQTSFYKLYLQRNAYYSYVMAIINRFVIIYKIKYVRLIKVVLKNIYNFIVLCAIILILIIITNVGGPTTGVIELFC
jgi:hypothetical protein